MFGFKYHAKACPVCVVSVLAQVSSSMHVRVLETQGFNALSGLFLVGQVLLRFVSSVLLLYCLCVCFFKLFRVVCIVLGFDTCKFANTILVVRLFGQGFQHLANAISHVRLFSVVCFGLFVCVWALDVLVCLSISGGMPPPPSTSCGNGRELVICCSGSNNLWAHCFANLVQMFVRALSMNFLHSNKLVSCHGKAWEWLSDGSEVAVGTVRGGALG